MSKYFNVLPKNDDIKTSDIFNGWTNIYSLIKKETRNKSMIIAIDGDYSTNWDIYIQNLNLIFKDKKIKILNFNKCILSFKKINNYFLNHLSDKDKLFGKITNKDLNSLINKKILKQYKRNFFKILHSNKLSYIICIGTGIGNLNINKYFDLLFYSNLTRHESINSNNWSKKIGKTQTISPNTFYYHIFPIMEKYQNQLIKKIDYYINFSKNNFPVIISNDNLKKIINASTQIPIKFNPLYEPGVWGGQWLCKKRKLKLPNCSIGLELIAQEQSLIFKFKNKKLEIPFSLIMSLKSKNILGVKFSKKYKNYFPVRIAYDDTYKNKGDNLSIQVHPDKTYIKKNFNEPIGQSEIYYITDSYKKSGVFLGFNKKISKKEFIKDVINSSKKNVKIDYEKYINFEKAKKGNLYLIPPGTVHASGKNNFVLEISNTPYRYTFKIYDYCRKNLDGKKRSLSIDHALKVLKFNRNENWIKQNLIPKPQFIRNINQGKEYLLSNNKNFTFNIYRIHFKKYYFDKTQNSLHIINLVEGFKIRIIAKKNNHEVVIKHSQTLLLPQSLNEYKILNMGKGECKIIKIILK